MSTQSPELVPPVEPSLSPVRFNAAKHGIFSVSPVIPWFETEEDWNEFRDSIFASLNPKDGLEQALTDRVAVLLWRIMRIIRFEREAISDSLSTVRRDVDIAAIYTEEEIPREMTPQLKERLDRMAMHRLIPDEDTLNKIMRYETKLHRYLLQTLHQLYALRAVTRPPRIRTDNAHADVSRIAVRSPRQRPPASHH